MTINKNLKIEVELLSLLSGIHILIWKVLQCYCNVIGYPTYVSLLGAFITWMTSGGCEVDIGGEGPTAKTTHRTVRALYRIFELQTLAWWKLLVLTSKKLAFKFSTYIFEYWPFPPYLQLTSTHVMNAARSSPFFAALPLACIIVNANRR